jgi:hypothetical protein
MTGGWRCTRILPRPGSEANRRRAAAGGAVVRRWNRGFYLAQQPVDGGVGARKSRRLNFSAPRALPSAAATTSQAGRARIFTRRPEVRGQHAERARVDMITLVLNWTVAHQGVSTGGQTTVRITPLNDSNAPRLLRKAGLDTVYRRFPSLPSLSNQASP